MSKTIRNSFDDSLTFEKMLSAHERALKHKGNKKEILIFNIDLETNICNIIKKLKEDKYNTSKYKIFTIYEPKERIVKSLPYIDRIVQQWYIYEFIKPYIIKRLVSDTCACIDKRGTHFAVKKTQSYMRLMKREYGEYYVLKCDVRKFFYSIDKNILFNIMKGFITDKKLLNLTYKFIYDSNEIGIPIGNYTSQYFANIYLNGLDHYIKEKLKIKYYVRYMDDFIILVRNKFEAKTIKQQIEEFIQSNLNLYLNENSRYYPNKMGVDFCGYRIYETHKLLRKRAKNKIRKKVILWNKLNASNRLNKQKMILEWNSFKAHSKHADSYLFREKIYNSIENKDLINM